MAVNGEVELEWADGTYKFNVAKIKLVLELQDLCGKVGIAKIMRRLLTDEWLVEDVRETLRLGLIGGGMMPDKAIRLINRYCDDRPWVENLQPAKVVIMAAMFGVPGDEVGKKAETDRAKDDQPSMKKADMSDPLSTVSAQQSDSPRATPMR